MKLNNEGVYLKDYSIKTVRIDDELDCLPLSLMELSHRYTKDRQQQIGKVRTHSILARVGTRHHTGRVYSGEGKVQTMMW